MRSTAILAVLVLAISTQAAFGQSAQCPTPRQVVFINKGVNDNPKEVQDAVRMPNTMVLLEANVDIIFSNMTVVGPDGQVGTFDPGAPFIVFGRCVTLASYEPQTIISSPAPPGDGRPPPVPGSGRTPHSIGPRLQYLLDEGPERQMRGDTAAFIEMNCAGDPARPDSGDGAKVLGIRVFGPNFNDHHTSEKGINIRGCHDVEIANTELGGWGGAAVTVDDHDHIPDIPDQEPKDIFVRIHDNYIHHNQYSNLNGHHLGYGIDVQVGAWAVISQNVFDFNKHSITASGQSGGYLAMHNLILKGGGFVNSFGERNIHVVDVHGTKNCLFDDVEATGTNGAVLGGLLGGLVGGPFGAIVGAIVGGLVGGSDAVHHLFNCGDAGFSFDIVGNTFQYNKTTDIKIRGKPKGRALISDNIFARSSQDDAINLFETDNVTLSLNQFNDDTFGRYGVCDVDGDGLDDLVLMTGVSWWFSSAGQFPWSFLRADTSVPKDVQLGDFDGDGRCDVLKDEKGDGTWMISSGATAGFKLFGNFLAPLNEVRFGRFDPASPDFNRGIRPPTHAFWRNAEGFWFVTPISQPNQWTLVNSSSFPLSDLRFGSFTGDGVTDVLAIEEGHWAISHAAREIWRNLNPTLSDPVKESNIFIANMDADDNVDDVLRLDVVLELPGGFSGTATGRATWQRSLNGAAPWSQWKKYAFTGDISHPEDYVWPVVGFVGQFRGAPGASTLTIDPNRIGHFFSPAQGSDREEWDSLFAY
jgi:Right handed beta helix region